MRASTGPPSAQVPASTAVVRGTVVVADMVGYSDIAKMLEENTSPNSVADLNRQIQNLISRAIAELPAVSPYYLISRTGDGAILLFEKAEAAHYFARTLHLLASGHNASRSVATAQRWFRTGIATGDVSRASTDSPGEYAGIAIANAVRLESAAGAGEIVIDEPSFAELPSELQSLYGEPTTVRGKRKETFRVRRYCVAGPKILPFAQRINRRTALLTLAGAGATAAAATWLGWPKIDSWLHPLPTKRFVALMAWPKPESTVQPILYTVMDVISSSLARAEASVKDLLIISSSDLGRETAKVISPQESMNTFGANLVLVASLSRAPKALTLALQVMDPAKGYVLRDGHLSVVSSAVSVLAEKGAVLARQLLGLPPQNGAFQDADELKQVSASAFAAFSEAENHAAQPNDVGVEAAISKYQETLALDPHFALGYAKLTIAYIRRHLLQPDPATLDLAGKNAFLAVKYNPDSAKAHLAQALAYLYSGKTELATASFAKALQAEPGNPEALLYQAQAFRDLNHLSDAEMVYRQIIKTRPNYWPAYNELGWILSRQAKYQDAADTFRMAAAAAPTVALPLANLSLMYMEIGKNDQATDAALRSIAIHPNSSAYLNLGDIAFSDTKYKEALDDYQKAATLDPKYHLIWRNIGDCYAMLGPTQKVRENYAKAAEHLSNDLKTNPRRGSSWMTLAFYHAKIGQTAEAQSDLTNADTYGASDLASQFLKVQALAVLGRKEDALALLLRCVDQGLSPLEVQAALDLTQLTKDPRYLSRVASLRRALQHSGS
jgi:tetratricopeptide (TPR) repeat protein/class 3 adenylate cyclase